MATTPKKAAAAKKPAAAKKAAPAPATRAPTPTAAPDGRVITVLAPANPKRTGSAAHGRFALYETGMTVAAFIAAGGQRIDVAYDAAHGFIRVDPAA
ncbi:MAG: hypothetical protein HIU82_12570 [Proteobacteria bacterium]|nr:hypothetical protein [Pseudomonadota bacterium]